MKGSLRSLPILLLLLILVGCVSDQVIPLATDSATSSGAELSQIRTTPLTISISPLPSPPPATAELPVSVEATLPVPNSATPIIGRDKRCGLILPVTIDGPQVSDKPIDITMAPEVVPEAVLPALEQLSSFPQTVGLVAFEVGQEIEGVYHNPDVPMPLASVVKIVNLIAYAEAVDQGIWDPSDWIPTEDLDLYYLPGSDLGAHERALRELRERGLIGRDPPSIPLEEIPWMMIRHSSNAASDYIHLTLGQERIESTAIQLGLNYQTAPCPWLGQFLIMNNHQALSNNNRAFVQELIDDPDTYSQEVMKLTSQFTTDTMFRQRELSQRWRSSIGTQSLFANNLNAQGTAREYAGLMTHILQNNLSSSYVDILVRRALEWPMEFEANQEQFSVVGYKNGSLPGVLTTAYYAQRLSDGAQIVVVLFFRELPQDTYRIWRRSLAHDELARWLLIDPDAIPLLAQMIN